MTKNEVLVQTRLAEGLNPVQGIAFNCSKLS
jgi:hypothetical protein